MSKFISSLERLLHEYDYFMMLYCSDNIHDIYKMIGGWNVDGVIALPVRAQIIKSWQRSRTNPLSVSTCKRNRTVSPFR